ncbi:MAG TPA: YciI family protein [Lacunisphaera sp.]|nr:YciI family protein [Lacunisphaera sp.]
MSSDPCYLLLLHQPTTGPGPTPDELRQIMGHFQTWMEGLRAKDIVVGTNGLEPTGKILRGPGGGVITDGPYAETKEVVGGYILIRAASLDAAVEIARGCPGLHYRLAVEVRPVSRQPE